MASVAGCQSISSGFFRPRQSGGSSMTRNLRILFVALAALFSTVRPALSQSALTVSYILPPDNNLRPMFDGINVSFPSVDINTSVTATVDISNQAPGVATVTGISISGTAFQVSGAPALPRTLPAGQSVRFGIVFFPTQPGT